MTKLFDRRQFLKASSAAAAFMCVEPALAAPIQIPTVDRLSIRVLMDGAANVFYRPATVAGVKSERPPSGADYRRALVSTLLERVLQRCKSSAERT